jgi:microcystin-dependent protein
MTINTTPNVATGQTTAFISIPVGTVVSYAGSVAPSGWLLCDGSPISPSTYPALHNLVGNNVPDLRSRFIVGAGQGGGLSNRPLFQGGGEENHTLSQNEMPSHTHTFGIGGGRNHNNPGTGISDDYASTDTVFTAYTSTAGANWAHNNMPPYYALTYIIKF